MSDDDAAFGPAMRALSPQQQRFVLAMAADPFGNAANWARRAGYSDVGQGAKVRASELIHNPRVEAAVAEFARTQINVLGPILATSGMLRIARNPKHKLHLKACELLANRVGFGEEQTINVVRTDRTGAAMVARIQELAAALGIDPAALLGANAAPEMKVVEHEPARVSDGNGVAAGGGAGDRAGGEPDAGTGAGDRALQPDGD